MHKQENVDYRKYFKTGKFNFESGKSISELQICFETWGELNDACDNAILVEHAITGTSHAASHTESDEPGWWEKCVGPGKAFDTEKYFVICSNLIGGCSGSSGPSSVYPETGKPYGTSFPVFTVNDIVRSQKLLIDYLGIKKLKAVTGGSLGGMQSMVWAATYPEMVNSIIPFAAPGRTYPQSIALRKAQRRAIMADPNWNDGNYYGKELPTKGIEIARMLGFVTYRTEKEFALRFGRNFVSDDLYSLEGRFEIEQYLEYHGKKLSGWFDANTYLYLSKAMDLHDMGRGCSSYEEGIGKIKSSVCMISFDSDILFPAYQQKEVVDILRQTNNNVEYHIINTIVGHDGFLIEDRHIKEIVTKFLSKE